MENLKFNQIISKFTKNQKELDKLIQEAIHKEKIYYSPHSLKTALIDALNRYSINNKKKIIKLIKEIDDYVFVATTYAVLGENIDSIHKDYLIQQKKAFKMLDHLEEFEQIQECDYSFGLIFMIARNNMKRLINSSHMDINSFTVQLAFFHDILIEEDIPEFFIRSFSKLILKTKDLELN
ncbi:hypothetical protein [Marixanthomonas ophiurae]|uniref:Uncharacterized protein n=1 Tax=Marixanthomonas ophiurae TaxID=387659 RepID=A0A3E1Q9L1_9FLAO|nr:hypothetical protein [Marixanthomonas ophiurae]RFN58818.1 hypothetical protein DZ858_01685 [Marixanthomonas ophiurae]